MPGQHRNGGVNLTNDVADRLPETGPRTPSFGLVPACRVQRRCEPARLLEIAKNAPFVRPPVLPARRQSSASPFRDGPTLVRQRLRSVAATLAGAADFVAGARRVVALIDRV